jgi:acetylglutamate kinase
MVRLNKGLHSAVRRATDLPGLINNIDFGHVGDITHINTELLEMLLERNYIPVISSIADDGEGNILNINADTVASSIAVAVKADKYITMTNVAGILDADDPKWYPQHYLTTIDNIN